MHWARNAARLILDMIVVDYDCSRLLRLLSRHVPQFSWRYGLSPQRLYQLVLEHMRDFLREGAHSARARVPMTMMDHLLSHAHACY